MLIIKKLQIRGSTILHPKKLRQFRLGYGTKALTLDKSLYMNKNQSTISQTDQTIQWNQQLKIPLIPKQKLQFQFYPIHQFGYNPDQIQCVGYASVIMQNLSNKYIQNHVNNINGNIIGKLYFQFNIANCQSNVFSQIVVSSMLAHLNNSQGKYGYIQIITDFETFQTQPIQYISGQLLLIQNITINVFHKKNETQKTIQIKIYLDKKIQGQVELQLQQLMQKKDKIKKIPIINKCHQCGIFFIEANIKKQNQEGLGIEKKNNKYGNKNLSKKKENVNHEFTNQQLHQGNYQSRKKGNELKAR